MSEQQLKAFLEQLKGDSSLQEKLKAAADFDAVTAIAKEAGFSISADDLKQAHKRELSEVELEGMAGGGKIATLALGTPGCVLVRDLGSALCNMPWKKIL